MRKIADFKFASYKTEISGANALTYVLTNDETGKYIAFEVTPRASAGASPGTLVLSSYQGPVTCPVPAQPSEITGNSTPCNGSTTETYSVDAATGVTYHWSVPADWSITAGDGTNEITVTVGSTSGDVEVYFSNVCGNGTARTLATTVLNVPAQPSEITGSASPCENATGLTYSVTNVSGVSYAWTVPTGWSIEGGQGTNEITVDAGTEAGNIEVTPSNGCGDGTSRTLTVTTTAIPGAPTEGTHVAAATQIEWNWNTVSGATGYKYHTADNYGEATDNGTSTTYTQTGLTCETGYTLYVWAYNTCGNSTTATLTETTADCNVPPVASNVSFSGTLQVGSTLTGSYTYYDADSDPEGTSTYKWYSADDASGTNQAEISGATALTYVLTASENGKYIAFEVTPVAQSGATPGTAVMSAYNATPVSCPTVSTPTAGTHVPSKTQIVYNWNTVSGATGYKYSTVNNYSGATDNGTSTTYTRTGLTCGTSYTLYVWAYNSCGNYSAVRSLTQSTSACYAVGDTYQGGVICYIKVPGDPGYVSGQTHGLIITSTEYGNTTWGQLGTSISTSQNMFTGQTNTTNIVNNDPVSGTAAKNCDALNSGGYSDWYLPSDYELYTALQNQAVHNAITHNGTYCWSSSQSDYSNAYFRTYYGYTPNGGTKLKNDYAGYHCMRTF